MDCSLCPWNSSGKNTGVGCQSLLQGIFPTQGLNPCILHCRQILYCLSHQGSSPDSVVTLERLPFNGLILLSSLRPNVCTQVRQLHSTMDVQVGPPEATDRCCMLPFWPWPLVILFAAPLWWPAVLPKFFMDPMICFFPILFIPLTQEPYKFSLHALILWPWFTHSLDWYFLLQAPWNLLELDWVSASEEWMNQNGWCWIHSNSHELWDLRNTCARRKAFPVKKLHSQGSFRNVRESPM